MEEKTMNKGLKVVRNGVTYEVRFIEERIWDSVRIYRYNPDAIIFKRKLEAEYLQCILAEMAVRLGGINSSAEDYLVRLAEYAVDSMISAQQEAACKQALRNKQEDYFNKMSS